MAAYIIARLVDDARPSNALAMTTRKARASAAKTWLASLALPAQTRAAFALLAEATGSEGNGMHAALAGVIDVTGAQLDAPSRVELEALLKAIPE